MTRTFIQTAEFVKNEKDNLTKAECNDLKKLINILEGSLKRRDIHE